MKPMRYLGLLLFSAVLSAQTDVRDLLERKTLDRLDTLNRSVDGALGVAAIDLETGRTFTYHADGVFPTASAIKVPVMIEVFRQARAGGAALGSEIQVTPKDFLDGSDRLKLVLRNGAALLTVRQVVEAMIEVSDNTAANRLIDLAGMDRVNRTLDELGCPNTRLRRKMMDWADTERRENISTPLEMVRIMESIYRGKAAPQADCAEMLAIMKRVEADFRRAVPSSVEVAAKPGEMPGVRCEAGIVFLPKRPFALAVMSTFIADYKNPVPEAAAIMYGMFEHLAHSNRYGHRLE